ncbi:hypothetical protein, partial [Xylanibacter rodentium]|jgi:hypothetical protein
MKKIFIVVFVGIFIMSQLCKSYGSIEAEIEKTHGDLVGSSGNKNTHKSDSISMSYDNVTNTIIIANDGGDKDVDVQIYKDGVLVYADCDNVGKGSSLNYIMTDEESGDYYVRVDVEGRGSIETTITNE